MWVEQFLSTSLLFTFVYTNIRTRTAIRTRTVPVLVRLGTDLELLDRHAFLAVLHHFRVVDRKLRARLVIVDVIDAHVDLSDGAARHGAVVAGHDGEPVEGF